MIGVQDYLFLMFCHAFTRVQFCLGKKNTWNCIYSGQFVVKQCMRNVSWFRQNGFKCFRIFSELDLSDSYGILSLQGLSFLDLRYHLLLFYLQDLTHLISIKTEGGKIKDSQALNRVVTIRTVRWLYQQTASNSFYGLIRLADVSECLIGFPFLSFF